MYVDRQSKNEAENKVFRQIESEHQFGISKKTIQTRPLKSISNLVDNESRLNSIVTVQRKKSPDSPINTHVLQRVPFHKFISNRLQLSADTEIVIYTHVKNDGMGDLGMLKNLAQIMGNHKNELHINKIYKCITIDSDFKDAELDAIGVTEDNSPNPRNQISQKKYSTEVWEIQCPIPDESIAKKQKNNNQFTYIREMTAGDLFRMEETETIGKNAKCEQTGLITPQEMPSEIGQSKIKEIIEGDDDFKEMLNWIGFKTVEDFINTMELQLIIVNVRSIKDGRYRPNVNNIVSWLDNNINISCKKIVLGVPSEQEKKLENVCTKEKLNPILLKYLMSKLSADSFIVAGGEALFSEAIGLSQANVLFGARYRWQLNGLLDYAKSIEKKEQLNIDLKILKDELDTMYEITESDMNNIISNNLEGFPQFQKLISYFRAHNINTYILNLISLNKQEQELKSSPFIIPGSPQENSPIWEIWVEEKIKEFEDKIEQVEEKIKKMKRDVDMNLARDRLKYIKQHLKEDGMREQVDYNLNILKELIDLAERKWSKKNFHIIDNMSSKILEY